MNNQYILTVIIPLYNNDKYIKRCLQSIINQSIKNIKIIIVDDGSTDDSLHIIRWYVQRYDFIECYTSRRQGPGMARNIGITNCLTKYITFIDSDDWIDLNAYEKCLDLLECNPQCDIAVIGVITEYDSCMLSQKRYTYQNENIIDSDLALTLLTDLQNYSERISPLVGNKVYRTSLITANNILFPDTYFEDNVFMFKLFYYSKYIILIPDNYLHYYQRTNSIMHSFSKKHITDFFESNLDIRDFLKNQNCFEDYKDIFFSYFQRGCRSLLNTLFCVEQDPHIQKKYLLEFMKCMEKNFDIEELINNIDINLIKKIWGL
jgi:glycosyltransferase involved in cell wall biosynthesis